VSALHKYDGVSMLDVPFADVFDEWDRRSNRGKNLEMVRALCQWDRYFLLVQVCGRTDLLHPWLYERCREVEKSPDNHIDLWAREHYKSTIITFGGVLQEILRDPEITVGIFSHTGDQAKLFLSQIKRELESNDKLRKIFPDIVWDNPGKQAPAWSTEGIIVRRKGNPKEPTVDASGLVEGMPTGMHYKLRVYDDVVTKESVSTPEQIQKSIDAYSLSQSLGVQEGRQWVIGTRYSYADAYDWMLKRGALQPRIYPATKDGTVDGKPVFFTRAAWDERVRNQTESDIACQMLQNPIAGHQRMFDVEDLQVYEVRPETLAVYILVDPARSVKKDSADTAMLAIGVDYANNKYLLDGFAHKMDLRARWEHLARLYIRWKQAPGVQQVKVGYEAFGAQADLDYFKEQQKLHKVHFDIMELAWPRNTEGSKTDRVQRLSPDIRAHKLYLPYATDEKNLTAVQRRMESEGYSYRIAKPIKRKNENNEVYDLSEKFKLQVHYFPMGLKDVVDAASRIYDMEPRPPTYREARYLEPEYV
jgi:hypothetical protein